MGCWGGDEARAAPSQAGAQPSSGEPWRNATLTSWTHPARGGAKLSRLIRQQRFPVVSCQRFARGACEAARWPPPARRFWSAPHPRVSARHLGALNADGRRGSNAGAGDAQRRARSRRGRMSSRARDSLKFDARDRSDLLEYSVIQLSAYSAQSAPLRVSQDAALERGPANRCHYKHISGLATASVCLSQG